VSLFGVVVTLGLFAYEIYGIEKCDALITAGKVIGAELELKKEGQFQAHPRDVLRQVNEPFAAAIIYPAVMAAWTHLALRDMARWMSPVLAAVVFAVGCALTLRYNHVLRSRAQITGAHAESELG
jgi:hypothetical protein